MAKRPRRRGRVYIAYRPKVQDYAGCKPIWEEHDANRKATGSKGREVVRNAKNPSKSPIVQEKKKEARK